MRSETVSDLVNRALGAMGEVVDSSLLEVISAAYTIPLRVTEVTLHEYPELRPIIEQAAQILLLQCAQGKAN